MHVYIPLQTNLHIVKLSYEVNNASGFCHLDKLICFRCLYVLIISTCQLKSCVFCVTVHILHGYTECQPIIKDPVGAEDVQDMPTAGLSTSQAFGVRNNTFAASCCWRGTGVECPMMSNDVQ